MNRLYFCSLSHSASHTSPIDARADIHSDSGRINAAASSGMTLCGGRTHLLRSNELVTTLTELNAIIPPATSHHRVQM